MKRLMWTMPVIVAPVMLAAMLNATTALAAAADDFDSDFANFKKTQASGAPVTPAGNEAPPSDPLVQPAVTTPVVSATTPAATQDPLATATAEADAQQKQSDDPLANWRGKAGAAATDDPMAAPAANPLGVAADLPVSGNVPATANALGATPEEIAMQMEMEAESQKEKLKQDLFKAALKQLLPLDPPQIRSTLESFKESREAAETPIFDPEPKTVVETVSLDPMAVPHTLLTAPGHVTTLSILDQTGSPWAIQDISFAGKFDVTVPEEGGHVLRIVPSSAHGSGNISIRLVDLITPITFTIKTGLNEVHYRFDARIPKQGPLAKTPLIEFGGLKATAGADGNLVNVLDGTTGSDGKPLKLDGVDGRTTAFLIDGQMYLRTPLTLLSPAWDSSASSADGMNVYTLTESPVIILSDRGQMVKAHIVE